MVRTVTTVLAALTLSFAPIVASAAISAGTVFTGTINQNLSSNTVGPGTPFTLTNVSSNDHNITGATIYGHVDTAQKAGQGTPGKIHLAFDRLVTRSGSSYALDARATNVQANTKSNAAKEAGGAVAGMIVGNILGKAVGTNIGGLLGAAGGYVVAHNNRQNVTIPSGSQVTLQVLSARPQASR
jgi:outer membrane lipoprotein SlyB